MKIKKIEVKIVFKSEKRYVKKEIVFKNYLFGIIMRSFQQSLMLLPNQFSFYFWQLFKYF